MKHRRAFEAVVTIQAARIIPPDMFSSVPAELTNPYVHTRIMVPKGGNDVTVSTNCFTSVLNHTLTPVWNQTFALPVMPSSDVFVFQMFNLPQQLTARLGRSRQKTTTNNPAVSQSLAQELSSHSLAASVQGDSESSLSGSTETESEASSKSVPGGELIGMCFLPVASLSLKGNVTKHALEVFLRPNEPGVGTLFVAAKITRTNIPMLEKADLRNPSVLSKYHSSRLSAIDSRFLGIGELAAFLFEEGYSTDPDAIWERALTLLAEQLAYRIWETTGSTDDAANFATAKRKVEQDGGLWDGL